MPENKDDTLTKVINDLVSAEGVDLVECRIFNTQGSRMIRCLVDYPEGGVSLETCARLNSRIVEFLEANPALGDNYVVEVNSPGLDRPLKTYKDFLRMKGSIVSLWLKDASGGKNFFEGELLNADEHYVFIRNKDMELQIEIDKIHVGKRKFK